MSSPKKKIVSIVKGSDVCFVFWCFWFMDRCFEDIWDIIEGTLNFKCCNNFDKAKIHEGHVSFRLIKTLIDIVKT